MKKYIYLLFLLVFFNMSSQINFEDHIKSIIKQKFITDDEFGNTYNTNERAVNYAIDYLKKQGVKTKYITNRNLLKKISNVECKDSIYTFFEDELNNCVRVKVKVDYAKFDISKHKKTRKNSVNYFDNKIAFGSYYGMPTLEIKNIEIYVDNRKISIPKKVYSNFYNVWQCEPFFLYKPLEVYSSEDGEYLFMYFFGGNAADTYFAKMIFNNEGYIATIVADYDEIIDWRLTMNKNFLGF